MVAWQRRVAGADQFRSAPIHRSESPTGYSPAGCSPAEPASASPVADNSTSNPGPARQSKCAAQPHCRDPVQVTLLLPVTHGVSSLLCAQGDISILRRHYDEGLIGKEVFEDREREHAAVRSLMDEMPPLDLGLRVEDLLAQFDMFAGFGAAELRALVRLFRPRLLVPDEVVIRKGERG